MGREAGFLALNGAIASGAEAAIIPEIAMEVDQLDQLIENGFRKSKNSKHRARGRERADRRSDGTGRACQKRVSSV